MTSLTSTISSVLGVPDWVVRERRPGELTLEAEPAALADLADRAMQELFAFRQVAVTPEGRAVGYHSATGTSSNFQAHFQSNGVELPSSMFAPSLRSASSKLSGTAMALSAPTYRPRSQSSGSVSPVKTFCKCSARWAHSMISAVRL